MTINWQKKGSQMYSDKDTWNGMYGICEHNCEYCYNRRWWKVWGEMRLNEKALKDNLRSGRNLFVGSSCDMFADVISKDWIIKVLEHCRKFDNTYLFQSKNPKRFEEFKGHFPKNTIYGITLETNRDNEFSKAPQPKERMNDFCIWTTYDYVKEVMVSIEPIMQFDLNQFVEMIKEINPEYVSIGANTNLKVKLPEPSKEKVEALIKELKTFTEVKIKDNLKRLMK